MNRDAFDDLAAGMNAAMIVLTTEADGTLAGCLVGFHSQCSIEPPRYAVWVSKANHTYRTLLFADHVAVHLLEADQLDLAAHFGTQSSDDVDKFADVSWSRSPEGVPLLDDCPNRFVARRLVLLEGETDHACVVVEPVRSEAGTVGSPLRLADVDHLEPGHHATERPTPPAPS